MAFRFKPTKREKIRTSVFNVIIAISSIFIVSAHAEKDYTNKAFVSATGLVQPALILDRETDIEYVKFESTCCCNPAMLAIFSTGTKLIDKRMNSATDFMVQAVANSDEQNDLMKLRIKNLKLINGMYSLQSKEYVPLIGDTDNSLGSTTTGTDNINLDGCTDVDINTQEGMSKYLETVDTFENSGTADYSLPNANGGSAYGRYQFMPSTAGDYCGKASTSTGDECCGDAWKSNPSCQDSMFASMTQNNANTLIANGIPINTCTLYMAHQQGAGGAVWIMTGKNSRSVSTLKAVVKNNVLDAHWSQMQSQDQTESAEGLRTGFIDFWNQKFGDNIIASSGNATPVGDVNEEVAGDNVQRAENDMNRRKMFRRGILFQHYKQNHHLSNIFNLLSERNNINTIRVIGALNE